MTGVEDLANTTLVCTTLVSMIWMVQSFIYGDSQRGAVTSIAHST